MKRLAGWRLFRLGWLDNYRIGHSGEEYTGPVLLSFAAPVWYVYEPYAGRYRAICLLGDLDGHLRQGVHGCGVYGKKRLGGLVKEFPESFITEFRKTEFGRRRFIKGLRVTRAWPVLAQVEHFGAVVEGEHGYRSSYIRIQAIIKLDMYAERYEATRRVLFAAFAPFREASVLAFFERPPLVPDPYMGARGRTPLPIVAMPSTIDPILDVLWPMKPSVWLLDELYTELARVYGALLLTMPDLPIAEI